MINAIIRYEFEHVFPDEEEKVLLKPKLQIKKSSSIKYFFIKKRHNNLKLSPLF